MRSAFAVLHSETAERVAVDVDYHHQMYELHHKVNSKEIIVGWYAVCNDEQVWCSSSWGVRYSTGSNLDTYSALMQNFYTQETAPHQAIHLVLDTGIEEGHKAGVKAYIRCVKVNL